MLGFYENFPQNIHFTELFFTQLSKKALQRHLIKAFYDINQKNFSFEEIGNPTVPGGIVIFELGIADGQNFCYIDKEEAQNISAMIDCKTLSLLDLFCAIRYYKNVKPKKIPLKFDYYMIRLAFGKDRTVELQIFHERGPRYLVPVDIADFLIRKANTTSSKKILNPYEMT